MAGESVTPIAATNGIQTATQLTNLIDQLFGTSTSGTSKTSNSSQADNPLQVMIAQLMQQLSMGNNDPQIQQLIGGIFQNFKENALPGVQGMANSAGVYNSTTQQLLQNDALSRAAVQGGTLAVQHQQNLQTQLASLLAILAKSTAATNTNTTNAKQGSAGNVGAAAGLGMAAKAIKDALSNRNANSNSQNGTNNKNENAPGENTESIDQRTEPSAGSNNDDPGATQSLNDYNAPNSQDLTADAGASNGTEDFGWLNDLFSGNDNIDSGFAAIGEVDGGGGDAAFGDSSGQDFGTDF